MSARDTFNAAMKAEGLEGPLLNLASAIFMQESGGGKNTSTTHAGATGLMQVIPSTFNRMADKGWDHKNDLHNARAGARYIKLLNERAKGDLWLTAAGYYGGEGGMDAARKGKPFYDRKNNDYPTTLEYADEVMGRAGMPNLQRGYSRRERTGKGPVMGKDLSNGTLPPTKEAKPTWGASTGGGASQPKGTPPYFVDVAASVPGLIGPALAKPSEVSRAPAATAVDPWESFMRAAQGSLGGSTPAVLQGLPQVPNNYASALAALQQIEVDPKLTGFNGFEGLL